jgi:hypothetical protein
MSRAHCFKTLFPTLRRRYGNLSRAGLRPEEWKTHVIGGTGSAADERRFIRAQLLKLFAICQERNINLPDLYREAERTANPERG